jgi:CheY-like chemotaxis protein
MGDLGQAPGASLEATRPNLHDCPLCGCRVVVSEEPDDDVLRVRCCWCGAYEISSDILATLRQSAAHRLGVQLSGYSGVNQFLAQGRGGYGVRGEDSHFARRLTLAENDTKPVVLVVDDEPRILDSIKELLADDFAVEPETDGARALEFLDSGPVAVILADQRMPGLSGDEFLAKARDLSDATRILLTGYADMDALIRAVNDGEIYKYVAKPWEPLQLKNTVFQAAERFRHLRHQGQVTAAC